MRAKNRVNPHGLAFFLTELHAVEGVAQTEIRCNLFGQPKRIVVPYDIERVSQGWYDWEYGSFIQDAFHFMNADEREFLQTGFTKADWDNMYPNELTPGEVKHEDGHIQMALPFDERHGIE